MSGFNINAVKDSDVEATIKVPLQQNLSASLYTAADADPEEEAALLRLSKTSGMTVEALRLNTNKEEARRVETANKYEAVVNNSPKLAAWLTNQAKARLAHDDTDNLSQIERSWGEVLTDPLASLGQMTNNVGSMIDFVNYSMNKVFIHPFVQGTKFDQVINDGHRQNQEYFAGANKSIEDFKSDKLQAQNKNFSRADGVIGSVGALYKNPLALADFLTQQLSQLLITGGAMGVATKGLSGAQLLAKASATNVAMNGAMGAADAGTQAEQHVRSMSFEKLEQVSPQYNALIADKITPEDAREMLAVQAGQVSATIALPLALGIGKIGAKVESKFFARLIGENVGKMTIKQALKAAPTTIGKEFLEGAADEALSSQMSSNLGVKATTDSTQSVTQGMGKSAVMGGAGGTIGGSIPAMTDVGAAVIDRHTARLGQVEQAKKSAQVLAAVDQLHAASKVKARDNEIFGEFIEQATADGKQNIYIDANVLMQSGKAQQLSELSPAVASQLETALATGGEIQIPIAEYAKNIAGHPLNAEIIPDLRVEGQEFTLNQANDYETNALDILGKELTDGVEGKQGDAEFKASRDVVKRLIKDQLSGAAAFDSKANEVNAIIASNRQAVRAAQLGMTPEEFHAKNPLFVKSQIVGENVFSQGPSGSVASVRNSLSDIGVEASISEKNGIITIHKIVVPEGKRNSGVGTNAMDAVVKYADETGQHIVLTPSADFGGNKKKLVQFYKRFGFVENKGKNRAFSTSESMFRQSSGKVLYQFAGEGAQTANKFALGKAQQLKPGQTHVEVDGVQRSALNSNGKPIAQTEEGIRNFWKWFGGDSKVVDAEGKPLVVYHGTTKEFASFDPSKSKTTGIFFSSKPDYANIVAELDGAREGGARIIPALVSLRNPLFVNSRDFSRADTRRAKEMGHDGLITLDDDGLASQITAFDPTQIKSATGNSGEFDPSNPNILFQFAGEGARTADTFALDTAQQLLDSGVSAKEVRKQTGWFKGVDDRWRFEINDADATLNPDVIKDGETSDGIQYRHAVLGELLDHPALFAAYPALREVTVSFAPKISSKGSWHDGLKGILKPTLSIKHSGNLQPTVTERLAELNVKEQNAIHQAELDVLASGGSKADLEEEIAATKADYSKHRKMLDGLITAGLDSIPMFSKENLKTILHEIQHGIQNIEGFATGGSPSEFSGPEFAKRDSALAAIADINQQLKVATGDKYQELLLERAKYVKDAQSDSVDIMDRAHQKYLKLAGEIEARNTANRYALSDEERINSSPESTADVKSSDAIVVFNGKEMLNAPAPSNAAPSPRGSFNPASSTIALLKNANLSTFLHELGHFFFENDINLASQLIGKENLTEGEQQIIDDVSALLSNSGIKGSPADQLDQWFSMSFEEQRPHHERIAESFEKYLFEGKAPSIELQRAFQTMARWMKSVYTSIKKFLELNPEAGKLSDEVRGVFDRMLATTEQIQLAESARSMMPLFASQEQAKSLGVTIDNFAKYQALGMQGTQDAIESLQARSLRDLQWIENAKNREVKKLKAESKEARAAVEMEVRREVMSQPVYQAWQFLTAKLTADDKISPDKKKSDPNTVDPSQDNLLTAIAKLGGIAKADAVQVWGVDPKDKPSSGVFGKPVLRANNGLSLDVMAERLAELGYLQQDDNGKADIAEFESLFNDAMRGTEVYSYAKDHSEEPLAGEQLANPGALTAGRIDAVELGAMGLPSEAVNRLHELKMAGANGLHPDLISERFGFSSGDELLREIAVAQEPKAKIQELTDQRMMEQYGDLATPEAIAKAADKAIFNEARAKFISAEESALSKALGHKGLLKEAAKEFAASMIDGQKLRDIKPNRYAQAEARAAKAASAASKKGDLATAASEKRNQLVNLYATKLAREALDESERQVKYFKKVSASKTLPPEYLSQIDALLEKYELRDQTGTEIKRTQSLRSFVQSQLAAGKIPIISESLLSAKERAEYVAQIESRNEDGSLVYIDDEERIKLLAEAIDSSEKYSYKEMTVEEMTGLHDTVRQIEHLGRLKNKLLTAKDKKTYQEKRDELTAVLKENARESGKNVRTDNTLIGKSLDGLKSFGVSHIKPATWMQIFDGGKIGGVWWDTIIRPANERATFETTKRAEATARLMQILAPVLKDVRYMDKIGKGKFFPNIGTSLNWEERFTIACQYGNESNLQRLMGGGIAGVTETLSIDQVTSVLESLSAKELLAVQEVWDHFESYVPEIAEKEKRVNGVEPQWIKARPFKVRSSDGEVLSLRGGYYPVVYDSQTSLMAQQHSDAQAAKDAMKAAYSVATTSRSFTKERVTDVFGRPLLLNLRGLYSGTNDVIHDLAWHEWVIDVNKLLGSKTIDAAIREHYGPNVKRELTKWRDDIVAGSKKLDHGIEKAAGFVRRNVSVAALGYNIRSALIQPLGIFQSMARIGIADTVNGVASFLSSPRETIKFVMESSEFMRNRARTMWRDLNELRNRISGQTTAKELMGKYAYFMTMLMQLTVDIPTWTGAYNKAKKQGLDELSSVAFADQAVKDSQGGGEEVDQAGITRGGPLVKLFTSFYEFMNTGANTLYFKHATAEKKIESYLWFIMIGCVVPVLGDALKAALKPGDDDDWDNENVEKTIVVSGLSNMLGMVAFGREFTSVAKALLGADKGMGYSGPTGLRVIPDSYKLAKQASQGEFDQAFRKAFVNVLGDIYGIPAVQLNNAIDGAEALNEGDTENPLALLFGYKK